MTQIGKAYSEVYIILDKLQLLPRLPNTVINRLLTEKADNHMFEFDVSNSLYEQIKNKNTMAIISYLYVKYLCEDLNEKSELISIYKENEDKIQTELREKYSKTTLFKNNVVNYAAAEETSLVVTKKTPIYKKILNKIKAIFGQ